MSEGHDSVHRRSSAVLRRVVAAPMAVPIEVGMVLAFYFVYSMIRNQFGSGRVSPQLAFDNAQRVIDVEEGMGLFHEQGIQEAFLGWDPFIQFWNMYYGTFHFIVPLVAMVWLYLRHKERYAKARTMLGFTTGLALLGFSLFPLMPPRLLPVGPPYGGLLFGGWRYQFQDTLVDPGGLWSSDSGTLQSISNQYAAMPSLHLGWSLWCAMVLVPVVKSRFLCRLLVAYPVATLFAVVVTGNHYWLDAVGGAVVLAIGAAIVALLTRTYERWQVPAQVSRPWPAPDHPESIDDDVLVDEAKLR